MARPRRGRRRRRHPVPSRRRGLRHLRRRLRRVRPRPPGQARPPKPASLSFAQAATVPISACAALHGLRDAGKLTAGQRVLITGAGGGVGGYAVQIAKADGAHVTGVCRTAKTGLVRSLGADHVIDHTREDFTTGADRYDLILDTAGNRRLGWLRRVLTPGARSSSWAGPEAGACSRAPTARSGRCCCRSSSASA
ncbi:zinc-binding dehydrogenase [Nonomuraea ferruginea]